MTALLYLAARGVALAVTCPHCRARGGQPCQSTGGGNHQEVATHHARLGRVAGFTTEQADAAAALLREVGRHRRWR